MAKCQLIYWQTETILARFQGLFVYANVINAMSRLTLSYAYADPQIDFCVRNVAFVLDIKYT